MKNEFEKLYVDSTVNEIPGEYWGKGASSLTYRKILRSHPKWFNKNLKIGLMDILKKFDPIFFHSNTNHFEKRELDLLKKLGYSKTLFRYIMNEWTIVSTTDLLKIADLLNKDLVIDFVDKKENEND